jgi:hypothetical protein
MLTPVIHRWVQEATGAACLYMLGGVGFSTPDTRWSNRQRSTVVDPRNVKSLKYWRARAEKARPKQTR